MLDKKRAIIWETKKMETHRNQSPHRGRVSTILDYNGATGKRQMATGMKTNQVLTNKPLDLPKVTAKGFLLATL